MEKFVFLVLASPLLFAGVLLGSFVLGSIAMFLRVRASGMDRRIRRVAYVWYMALLSLAGFGCLVFVQFAPAAAAGGWVGLMALVLPLGFGAVGAGYVHAAAGRSMDIEDTTDLTWLVFIPFVALWLAVKRGMDRPTEPVRSDLGGDIAKLALVVLPLWLVTAVSDDLRSRQGVAAGVGKVLIERATSSADAAELASATMAGSYFWSKFEGYPLGDIARDGNEIQLVYSVPPHLADRFDEAAVAQQFGRLCSGEGFQTLHRKGIVTTLTFSVPNGRTVAAYSATGTDCVA